MSPPTPTRTGSATARPRRSTATGTAERAGPQEATSASPDTGQPRTRAATVRLPFLTARFEFGRRAGHTGWRLGPVGLPSPGKSAYYLGLGVLAVGEVVEWPVAAAIAAGTYVAQHTRGQASAVPQVWHASHNGHQQEAGI
ncbi:hypothetical protein Franean1_3092 [Parafrankia sp. EAN1pec]|nr:hypothetical protein Franean1_2524 [Frankia sp. EAN1pec]ABW12504.1 hypothetical protein Franean1_3092 [Frankia sp. EAN1pec]